MQNAPEPWYERLGFSVTSAHHFAPGLPAFITVVCGPVQLYLSQHEGDAEPDTLIHLDVDDVDPIANDFGCFDRRNAMAPRVILMERE